MNEPEFRRFTSACGVSPAQGSRCCDLIEAIRHGLHPGEWWTPVNVEVIRGAETNRSRWPGRSSVKVGQQSHI